MRIRDSVFIESVYEQEWLLHQNSRNIADPSAVLYEPRHDKTSKMSVRPAKTQISLGIRLTVRSVGS